MPMHADEVEVPGALVRALVDRQFPEWAGLPLQRVTAFGTDHTLFRLGAELLVRMPVYAASAGQAASDATWLPRLAPYLPVVVPAPVALGEPDPTYPFRGRWCPGSPARRSGRRPSTACGWPSTWPSSSWRCVPWTRPGVYGPAAPHEACRWTRSGRSSAGSRSTAT